MILTRLKNEISMRLFNAGVRRAAAKHCADHDYAHIDGWITRYRAAGGLSNAIQPYKLWSLRQILEQEKPRSIIEFGAGLSSVVFAEYAKASGARVLSVDEDARWLENAKALAGGADAGVEFRQAPRHVERASGTAPIVTYDFRTDEAFDLAFIDGPSAVVDGVKQIGALNLDVLNLAVPPRLILIDVRQATARHLAHALRGDYDVRLSGLFRHAQFFNPAYDYFSVFRRKEKK